MHIDHRKDLHYAVQRTTSWRDSNGKVLVEEIAYNFIPGDILAEEQIRSCKSHIASAKRIHTYHSDKVEVVKDLPEEFEFDYKETSISDVYGKEVETHQCVNYKIVKVKIRLVE